MADKSKIIAKIVKLMRHERSARQLGNEGEANNFKRRIALLRAAYQITEEILIDEEQSVDDFDVDFVFDAASPHFRRAPVLWEAVLFEAVAYYFDCRPLISRVNNLKKVAGDQKSRASVIEAYLFLADSGRQNAAAYLKSNQPPATNGEAKPPSKNTRRKSFLHGFSYALLCRLGRYRNGKDAVRQLKEHLLGESLLPGEINCQALVKSEKLIIAAKRSDLTRERSGSGYSPPPKTGQPKIEYLDSDAYFAGLECGDRCALTRAIELPARADYEEYTRLAEIYLENQKRREEQEREQRTEPRERVKVRRRPERETTPVADYSHARQMSFNFGE